MSKLFKFFDEVKFEMNKVSWPTWDELKRSTYIVLNLSFILILFLFIVDLILSKIINYIL